MIITATQPKRGRRNRVEVYVDGELRFDVGRDTAQKKELRPGRVIDGTEIESIVAADARRAALETAGAMLARRPRSEREIRRRLAQRRYGQAIVHETVERLRALGLIDDAVFAQTWTESRDRSSPRGRRMIAGELRAHGVQAEVARDAAEAIDEDDAAYRLARRRMAALDDSDSRLFAERLGGYLQRRGFGWDVVRTTVRRCWAEAHTDDRESIIG
jgi:regulatory protein